MKNTNQESWLDEFITAFGEQGLIVLGFYIGSLFRNDVDENKTSWPFLELIGEPGSGKSTLIEYLNFLFESEDIIDPCRFSRSGIRRLLARNTAPVVAMENRHNSFEFDEFKKLFDGDLGRVCTKDGIIKDDKFIGGVIIESELRLNVSEVMRDRIVTVDMSTREHSNESMAALKRLKSKREKDFQFFSIGLSSLKGDALNIYDHAQHVKLLMECLIEYRNRDKVSNLVRIYAATQASNVAFLTSKWLMGRVATHLKQAN